MTNIQFGSRIQVNTTYQGKKPSEAFAVHNREPRSGETGNEHAPQAHMNSELYDFRGQVAKNLVDVLNDSGEAGTLAGYQFHGNGTQFHQDLIKRFSTIDKSGYSTNPVVYADTGFFHAQGVDGEGGFTLLTGEDARKANNLSKHPGQKAYQTELKQLLSGRPDRTVTVDYDSTYAGRTHYMPTRVIATA